MSNFELIRTLLDFSTSIYDENSDSDNCLFFSDKKTDIQCSIKLDRINKHMYIIFRGSSSIKDFKYDLYTIKTQLKDNIYVHSGFYGQLHGSDIFDKLINKINYYLMVNSTYKIYITGHSLGGALATLFGYELSFLLTNNVNIVSFASPRVGNYYWKKSFKSKSNLSHIRVVNKRDPIPYFPIYFYYHVGTKLPLSENDNILPFFKILNHECENYKKALINKDFLY